MFNWAAALHLQSGLPLFLVASKPPYDLNPFRHYLHSMTLNSPKAALTVGLQGHWFSETFIRWEFLDPLRLVGIVICVLNEEAVHEDTKQSASKSQLISSNHAMNFGTILTEFNVPLRRCLPALFIILMKAAVWIIEFNSFAIWRETFCSFHVKQKKHTQLNRYIFISKLFR